MQSVTEMTLPTLPVEQAEFAADPQPFLEAARLQHPWLARFHAGYIIHGYQAAHDILYMDDKLSVNFAGIVERFGGQGTAWGEFMETILPTVSGERHKRLRTSVAQAFTPRSANQMRPLMQQVIAGLLDEWAPKGHFDFADFASYFPVTVMCGLLGISPGIVPGLRHALETQVAAMSLNRDLLPSLLEGYQLMFDAVDQVVREREKSGSLGDGSLLDELIACKNAGGLDETELRHMLMVLLLAGYDTSKNALTLTMYYMMRNPDMWLRCAEDKAYCAKAVQEILRHTSIVSPYRLVTADFDYGGVHFPQGTTLCFALSLTGRDPAVFTNPLEFQPERTQEARPISFGRGMHICLGQYIARVQLEEGLHLIAQRLENPHPAGDPTWRPFLGAWGLRTLPMAFDPAPASRAVEAVPAP